ncbi:GDSL-type esterase/lipase family protein [Leptospira inadai]|uniref:GDSL-type esterase/lipase family protein n=1 Tax=Leptospira inadai TaxID=29506 RepID=UPI000289A8FB|nr:GDSL-type esterase/lipase family protein [Leptospira inadai]
MKRSRVKLVLVTIFCTLSIGAQPAPYKLVNPVLIRPFGDSITYGIGFTDDWKCPVYPIGQYLCMPPGQKGGGYRGWMTLLSISGDGIVFTTEGYQSGGSYVQQWLSNTQTHDGYPGWTIEQLTPIANYSSFADITLVHAGTNDMWQILTIKNPTDAQIDQIASTAGANLFTLIDILLKKNQKTHVFAAQIIKVAPPKEGYDTVNKVILKYNNYISNNWYNRPPENRARMTLMDMHHTLQPGPDYSPDGVHPSTLGYMKMACSWIRAIKNMQPNQEDPCSGITTSDVEKN